MLYDVQTLQQTKLRLQDEFLTSAAEEGSLLRGDASSGEYFLTFQCDVHG
jgi:hypothetical protein